MVQMEMRMRANFLHDIDSCLCVHVYINISQRSKNMWEISKFSGKTLHIQRSGDHHDWDCTNGKCSLTYKFNPNSPKSSKFNTILHTP